MSFPTETFTIGVEEEYQIIDPQTRHLCPDAYLILPTAQSALGDKVVQPEFRESQIEVATPVCRSLQEVRAELSRLRGEVITAAATAGRQIAAAGTHPFSHWQAQTFTPKPHYLELVQNYRRLMRELVTFGCHVHIGISDREMAIQVMNRSLSWLAPILALSASSPFWLGSDTGYASYRTTLISRLPMAGVPQHFTSYQAYRAVVNALVTTQTIQSPAQICWDIRLSERFPTLEFRIMDACTTIDEAVLITGLIRALVKTCYEQVQMNVPYTPVRSELLQAANWRAARSGLEAELIDANHEKCVSARERIEQLLTFVRPALQELEEWNEVYEITQKVLKHGTSAARQREIYQRTESFEKVMEFVIQETAKATVLETALS